MRALVLVSVLLTVYAVIGQTPTPITTLGVPTMATTPANGWAYWSIQVSILSQMDATDKLFFAVTPFIGDADLYVSKTQFPQTTDCDHCILKSASHFDEVKYLAKNDPAWPSGTQDTFYIGVHGYTQTEYTFTAWTSKTNVTLLDSIPQVGWVRWGTVADFVFYEYTLSATANFTLSLTPRGADVDLFVTTDPNVRPVSIATSQWHGRRIGFDVIEIGVNDPHFKPAGSKYYIGIQGFSILGTTFSLYATLNTNYTRIMEGIPLSNQVDAGQYKYFSFDLTGDYANHRLTYTVLPLTTGSDPDIYITRDISRGPPSATNCEWCHAASGRDVVTIENAPQAMYYIAVRAYGRTAHFQITAATEYQSLELQAGIDAQGGVLAGQYQYFRYYHGNPKETLTITVTPWRGTVELYESMTNTKPDENKHDRKGIPMGLERVLRYNLQYGEAPTGYFYLAVKGNQDSNFTILAATNVTYTILQDGRPQYYQLVTNRYYRYYIFDIIDEDLTQNSAISFTVSTIFGDADLYVSMINHRPTQSNYTWKSEDYLSDTVVIHTNDPNISHHRRFYVGVYGATYTNQDTYFNILAHKSGSVINLADGQAIHSTVDYDKYTYFRYHISDVGYRGPVKISIATHDTNRRVRAYADDNSNNRPTSHHYKWSSTLFGESYLTIPDAREGTYYIGVYGTSWNSSDTAIPFTISASRAFEILDANSGNVLRSISDPKIPDRYRFTVDDLSYYRTSVDYIQVALTLISGRCRLYMNPASNRTDDETYTTPENALYRSLSPNGNVILLLKTLEQKNWHNTWNVLTYCDEPSDYFIAVGTATSVRFPTDQPSPVYGVAATELVEGVPMLQAVPFQDRFVYSMYLPPTQDEYKEDYLISLRLMDGKISVYASQDYNYIPNPKNYTFKAENIEEDTTIVLNKEKLNLATLWGGRLFISVYGAWLPMLHGQSNKFEINVYKTSAPRYLGQDQPLPQFILEDQFTHGSQNVYTHYRILNSIEHPDDLEFFIESCEDLPAVVPVAYGSSQTHHPGPHNKTYTSQADGKFKQYFKTSAETKQEDRVFYVGVENKPNKETARHYSVYATTLDDSRPIVHHPELSGRVDNDHQLGDTTVAITINLARHPSRYRDGSNFLYQVFAREIKHGEEHKLDQINFDTVCAITNLGQRMNIIHKEYNDTLPGTLEIFAGPFDPNKQYYVNVFAHSESIFGLATPYKRAYVINGVFYQEYPSGPFGPGTNAAGIFFLVLFIILLVLVAIFITYLIVGFVIRSRQGHKGWEALPNSEIWIKVVSKLTCGKLPSGENYGTLRDEPVTTSNIQSGSSGYGTV